MHDLDMKSRVHPKYKTKYHVGNWPAYDRALVQRGDILVWLTLDAVATWDFASRSQISTLWWVRGPWSANRRSMLPQFGRHQWKEASGYHRHGRVENAFFRYTCIIGVGLRARSPVGQGSEAVLGCAILNRMTALGRPVSYRIGK